MDNIPFDQIEHEKVRDREDLLYLVAGASFVEIASDLYTTNLVDYFEGDEAAVLWLGSQWQHEELRHGYSLRDYVLAVWPEFDWQSAYNDFFAEYSKLCTVDEFEPTRGLEMAARCVVETGTATFYTALAELSPEPVLSGIAACIRTDEVGHYKYFYKFFREYNDRERLGRWRVWKAIKRRVLEARNSDADIALWHVYTHRSPNPDKAQFKILCKSLGKEIKGYYPVNMAAKMVLRPLALPNMVNQFVEGPLSRAAGWMLR
ncbi:ferritin-like domain-containing protein [Pusillimonas sp. CC-YST705]|uniref:Ferritin-like domain-containing protein n=1 Tax=Mesopusillimonas faecipullorum TaxID=2755040 RepID=A0ABS8CAB3_9BURK|nr:ferritin-like domain-containing protein [Mesopusillimonas faecipullorum]